jgi:murein endopeptidase
LSLGVHAQDTSSTTTETDGYVPPDFPFLEGEQVGSVSVGDVTGGHLVYGRPVPLPGRGHTFLPRHAKRGLHYGTDELVDLIEFVGYRLRRRRGMLLRVGNLARREGGDITYSVSHNSGRDVDVAFCYKNAAGKRVRVADFIALDGTGKSYKHGGRYRFDAACTWSIVTAVLRHPGTQVQYIFISNPLKKLLLDYARTRRSGRLIARANAVLHQPGRRAHDDHLHIRVYCSEEDIGLGCVDNGVQHSWIKTFPNRRAEALAALVAHLNHSDGEQRARAIKRLVILQGAEQLGDIEALLSDPDVRPRIAAADAIGELGTPDHVAGLARAFETETDNSVRRTLFNAAIRLGGPDASTLLEAVLTGDDIDPELRSDGLTRAGLSRDKALVPALIGLLSAPLPAHGERALRALRRLSNQSLDTPAQWREWWAQSQGSDRDAWLLAGFTAADFEVGALDKKHVWKLVPALLGPDHIAHNAAACLERITAHQPRDRPPVALCEHWVDWLDRRVRRLRLPRTPRGLRRSCSRPPAVGEAPVPDVTADAGSTDASGD